MAIKSKSISHSIPAKVLAFALVVFCFTQTICKVLEMEKYSHWGIVLEESYYLSEDFIGECNSILTDLRVLSNYKSEENILNGGTITERALMERLRVRLNDSYWDFSSYIKNLSEEEYHMFLERNQEDVDKAKKQLIEEDLYRYKSIIERLNKIEGLNYYVKNGEYILTNSNGTKEDFTKYPVYLIYDEYSMKVFPEEIKANERFYWLTPDYYAEDYPETIYIAFNDEFLSSRISEWEANKKAVQQELIATGLYFCGLGLSFIYLVWVWGRRSRQDQEIYLNPLDRVYNDINLIICFALITLWGVLASQILNRQISLTYQELKLLFPVTMVIATIGLLFVLSLVKHIKNKTFFKHTLIYTIFHKLFLGLKAIYDRGSLGVKVAILVVGYPAAVALTIFIFPVTIGVALWLAMKKVKEYQTLKAGVTRIKEGDFTTKIELSGKGELAQLAHDLNSIADGFHKAVENELKSQRLKTELLTNVSHDIRTPLTSIITYVDLLKNQEDPQKIKEYVEVLEQKSQRLKVLTDDLFEAAKASSGNIPVQFERIDIAALLSQGLGELDEKIQERKLKFKVNYPQEKLWVKADGRLLWRSLENLLSNVLKYALEGSRVYIDLEDAGPGVRLIIKNISAHELNISADELMERFVRGDESRSSQGSGLGLSIVKSLIELQKGSFAIEVDGDLFKAIIFLNKYKEVSDYNGVNDYKEVQEQEIDSEQ